MRWSQVLIPTVKDDLANIPAIGDRLMIRAGLIRKLGEEFAFLPLGFRSLTKALSMLREIFDGSGAQEVALPESRNPADVEELAGSCIRSYKQLPLSLFQFHGCSQLTCFTFCPDESSATAHSARMRAEVRSLLGRLGISPRLVESLDGELLAVRSASGPDTMLASSRENYFATPEVASTAPREWSFGGEPQAPLETIHTPGRTSVADVCAYLGINSSEILKTLVFAARSPITIRWLVAVVRGDHQVNLNKLSKAASEMGVTQIAIADSEEATRKWPMGFVGPDAAMKLPDALLIVDPDAAQGDGRGLPAATSGIITSRTSTGFATVATSSPTRPGRRLPTSAMPWLAMHRRKTTAAVSNLPPGLFSRAFPGGNCKQPSTPPRVTNSHCGWRHSQPIRDAFCRRSWRAPMTRPASSGRRRWPR